MATSTVAYRMVRQDGTLHLRQTLNRDVVDKEPIPLAIHAGVEAESDLACVP